MKIRSYKFLFRLFSYLSDRTNGASFFVKYKLTLGTIIIGLTGSVATAKAQKEDTAYTGNDTIIPPKIQVTCYVSSVPSKKHQKEEIEVRGNVTDEAGEPMTGTTIVVKGTTNGVVADAEGNFKLRAKITDTLSFTFIGYKKKEIEVSLFSNKKFNHVILEVNEDVELSCYIVVTGQSNMDRNSITCYTTQTVDPDLVKREKRNIPQINPNIIRGNQETEVKGNVTDRSGEAIIGTSVYVKGTANGTITDPEGNFTLKKVKMSDVLVFAYIGFKQQEVSLSKVRPDDIKVVLEEDDMVLCYEVVVVSYRREDDIYRRIPKKITKLSYDEAQTPPVSRVGYRSEFEDWVNNEVRYNDEMLNDKIEGTVEASFVIDKRGNVKDVKITKKLHPYADAEVLRALSALGKWTPGEHNGKKIKTTMSITVNFALPENK